jgi:hypothetical protein
MKRSLAACLPDDGAVAEAALAALRAQARAVGEAWRAAAPEDRVVVRQMSDGAAVAATVAAAAAREYGVPGVRPRPVLAPLLDRMAPEIGRAVSEALRQALGGR